MQYDTLVIGAGQAGLATAYALKQAGMQYRVLEAGLRAAGSWPSYYESLILFSPARYSSLPGLPFPGDPDRYPARNEVIDYLESYARHHELAVEFDSRVVAVRREGVQFVVATARGQEWRARSLVVASGPFNQPNRPGFPGLEQFQGLVLHSSEYRRPSDVQGARIAVVGAGNSAVQIAYELAVQHKVTLISRQPPSFMKQRPFGKDVHFWLRNSGLDTLPVGAWFNWRPTEPVLDQGEYRQAFQDGRIRRRPMFDHLTATGLAWGREQQSIDTLLLATGFSNRPAYLGGLDGLTDAEASRQRAGVSARVPGLYFVGTPWQRSHASATLRGVGPDAAHLINHLKRYLAGSHPKAAQAEVVA